MHYKTLQTVENHTHLGLSDAKVYNINPVSKKNGKGTRGGVALIVKKHVAHFLEHVARVEQEREHNGLTQAITIKLRDKTLITGVYCSPQTPPASMSKTLDEIAKIKGHTHFIIGDINAKSRHWTSTENAKGKELVRWTARNPPFTTTAPAGPTFRSRKCRGQQ